MAVVHLFRDYSFDDAATRIMWQAFAQASDKLGEFGQDDRLRVIMAKRIVEAAANGERDCGRLREQALRASANRLACLVKAAMPTVPVYERG